MKSLIIAIPFLFSLNALAAPNSERIKQLLEFTDSCGTFVRYDDQNVYVGFGQYKRALENPRLPIPAAFSIIPLDGSPVMKLATKDAAIDMITEGNRAFILTHSSIEEWDLSMKERLNEYPTYNYTGIMAQKEHSMAFAKYNNKVIIAHGRLGLSFFDLNEKKVTNQFRLLQSQLPLESMAMGVTIQGRHAYVMMDNYHLGVPGPFRGIIVVDMETEKVVSELPGLDPGVTTVTSDAKNLIVSYAGNPVWKFKLASLQGQKKLPAPVNFMKNYPIKGHPTGSASMDDKYYYTCFFKAPSYPGENGGVHIKMPIALDRELMEMN